jgi:hypothetical protein
MCENLGKINLEWNLFFSFGKSMKKIIMIKERKNI